MPRTQLPLQGMQVAENTYKPYKIAVALVVLLLAVLVLKAVNKSQFYNITEKAPEAEYPLSFSYSAGVPSGPGLVLDNPLLLQAALLGFTLLFLFFPRITVRKAAVSTPHTLLRNLCCIIPKGP